MEENKNKNPQENEQALEDLSNKSQNTLFNRMQLWPEQLINFARKYFAHLLTIGFILVSIFVVRIFTANLIIVAQDELKTQAQKQAEQFIEPTLVAGSNIEWDNTLGMKALPPVQTQPDVLSVYRISQSNTLIPERESLGVFKYTVQTGENLFYLADKFELKPETILWGNYETLYDNPQYLQAGQELNILPVDGVYYYYNAGEDLQKVAEFFGVNANQIVEFEGNNIDAYTFDYNNPQLQESQWLIIPGGERELANWGPPAVQRDNPAIAEYYGAGFCGEIYEGAVGMGSFLWPNDIHLVTGYQYYPPIHPGVDLEGSTGDNIYATDNGVVVYAGWSDYGFGNLVIIDHGSGWQSVYAHLDTYYVSCGQSVTRGDVIALMGNTGNSSGSHLHFELISQYGHVNPLDYFVEN